MNTVRGMNSKWRRMVRARLWEAQKGVCASCGLLMRQDADGQHDLYPSLDHVQPRSFGGGGASNYLLMHRLCNQLKGNAPPSANDLQWLARVQPYMIAEKARPPLDADKEQS
jgi:5-methylcytosine-specific restriction endonuclease McrA